MSSTGQKNKVTDIKKTSTLENKHRLKIKEFENEKDGLSNLQNELISVSTEISDLDKIREKFTNVEQKRRADLLDMKDDIEKKLFLLKNNIQEMDYYDKAGDLLVSYYNIKDTEADISESKNILSFLCKKKIVDEKPKNDKPVNKTELFEKYCQITEGIRVTPDDGSKRLKYCLECKIEKI